MTHVDYINILQAAVLWAEFGKVTHDMIDVACISVSIYQVDHVLRGLHGIFVGNLKKFEVIYLIPYLVEVCQILGDPIPEAL